jgi:hypothetical protein
MLTSQCARLLTPRGSCSAIFLRMDHAHYSDIRVHRPPNSRSRCRRGKSLTLSPCSLLTYHYIQLLNFLKMSFTLFFVCSFFAITILMPVNYMVGPFSPPQLSFLTLSLRAMRSSTIRIEMMMTTGPASYHWMVRLVIVLLQKQPQRRSGSTSSRTPTHT